MSNTVRLLTIGIPTCGPCKQTNNFIKENFQGRDINYHYVDGRRFVTSGFAAEEVKPVVKQVMVDEQRVRSVPHNFIVDENNEILDEWIGFNSQRIMDYVYDTLPKYQVTEEPKEELETESEEGFEEIENEGVLISGEKVKYNKGMWFKIKKDGSLYKKPISPKKVEEITRIKN